MEKVFVIPASLDQGNYFIQKNNLDKKFVKLVSSDICLHGIPFGSKVILLSGWYGRLDRKKIEQALKMIGAKTQEACCSCSTFSV
jgi:hypothetical protein